jgi:hypothetical protein
LAEKIDDFDSNYCRVFRKKKRSWNEFFRKNAVFSAKNWRNSPKIRNCYNMDPG